MGRKNCRTDNRAARNIGDINFNNRRQCVGILNYLNWECPWLSRTEHKAEVSNLCFCIRAAHDIRKPGNHDMQIGVCGITWTRSAWSWTGQITRQRSPCVWSNTYGCHDPLRFIAFITAKLNRWQHHILKKAIQWRVGGRTVNCMRSMMNASNSYS